MTRPLTVALLLIPSLAACELEWGQQPPLDDTAPVVDDRDGDGWATPEDCDDDDPEVFPGTVEWCNGVDDDCDGTVDEDEATDATQWYPDADGDGFGASSGSSWACEQPSGRVADNSDCDDGDASTYPGAAEVCGDGVVNDCDAQGAPCIIGGTLDADEADAVLYGAADGDRAGQALASAGDVDGDGVGDLLVGAPYADDGGLDAGAAYLLLGPVQGEISPAMAQGRMLGTDPEGAAGRALRGVGDVNADGYDDILVGAPYDDAGGSEAGAAYLVLGPFDGELSLDAADAMITGPYAYDWTGWSLAGGDIDGDGFDDVLVGAPYSDREASNNGAIYLFLGPMSGALTPRKSAAMLMGEDDQDNAGRALAAAGDVDGDGLTDLIVGAPGRADLGTNAGGAYLQLGPFSGAISLDQADARLAGEAEHDGAGNAVAGAGDVDGDGTDDLLVGASTHDDGGTDAGVAYLISGTTRGWLDLEGAQAKLTGEAASDLAGSAVAGAGDVDGDGFADVLVGAPGRDSRGTDAGAAYLLLGPLEGGRSLGAAELIVQGAQSGERLGTALAGAGDASGDGYDDLLLGAPDSDLRGSDRGATFLFGVADW
jgi:hypothetical protein